MTLCAFMGDDLSALGFRLAGVDCHCPDPTRPDTELAALFRRLRGEVALLLITAEIAARLPADLLRRAEVAERPLILVIPDVRQRVAAPDRAAAMRRQLGMSE